MRKKSRIWAEGRSTVAQLSTLISSATLVIHRKLNPRFQVIGHESNIDAGATSRPIHPIRHPDASVKSGMECNNLRREMLPVSGILVEPPMGEYQECCEAAFFSCCYRINVSGVIGESVIFTRVPILMVADWQHVFDPQGRCEAKGRTIGIRSSSSFPDSRAPLYTLIVSEYRDDLRQSNTSCAPKRVSRPASPSNIQAIRSSAGVRASVGAVKRGGIGRPESTMPTIGCPEGEVRVELLA